MSRTRGLRYLLLLCAACSPSSKDQPAETLEIQPGPAPSDAPFTCPEGMALVYAAESSIAPYCIDQYETYALGNTGDFDQHTAKYGRAYATSISEAGREPSALSFSQAVVICENTPMRDAAGTEVGRKRLAALHEWTDAGDGVLGAGGSPYPYGETYVEGACHIPDGPVHPEHSQESAHSTGASPDCVSVFGVYDLLGNLWEWVDSGLTGDIQAWFDHALPTIGVNVTQDEEGNLVMPAASWHQKTPLTLSIAGVGRDQVTRQSNGQLTTPASNLPQSEGGQSPAGFLSYGMEYKTTEHGPVLQGHVLPVIFEKKADGEFATLRARSEVDGVKIGLKVGGSWYTGSRTVLQIKDPLAVLTHPHDFRGSIAARCAGDPIPR